MPDLSEWYGRNLRDFIRAHMGYRFVVRDAKFGSYPGFAYIGLTIENTGFGQLLQDDDVEVVFSGERGVFAVRPRGGIPLCDIGGGERRAMQIELDYPKSMPAGDYDVLLRVSSARHPIQFANEDCWNETLKANRLCGVVLGAECPLTCGHIFSELETRKKEEIAIKRLNLDTHTYHLIVSDECWINQPEYHVWKYNHNHPSCRDKVPLTGNE